MVIKVHFFIPGSMPLFRPGRGYRIIKYLLLVISISGCYGCHQKQPGKKLSAALNKLQQTTEFHKLPCDSTSVSHFLKLGQEKQIDSILTGYIIKGWDPCVLEFVDQVFRNYQEKPVFRNFVIISHVLCHADGYISERVVDLFPQLFREHAGETCRNMFELSQTHKFIFGCFRDFLGLYIDGYDMNHHVILAVNQEMQGARNPEYREFLNGLVKPL